MKDSNEVIQEFNEVVNMTASELEKWLKSDDSNSAGWPKEDENGETVGHDSGRKIVDILKANPKKEPEKYTDDQVQHMRKVVSYCKRHLAQETKTNNDKSEEEVKQTKSYASLKNWGHDFLKAKNQDSSSKKDEGEDEEAEEEKEAEDDAEDEKKAGDKRKTTKGQEGSNKKRETRQGKAAKEDKDEDEDEGGKDEKKSNGNSKQSESKKKDDASGEDEEEEEEEEEGSGGKGSKPKKGPKKGDTVSWNWGNGQPEGKVLDVKGEDTSIKTKRGNEVSRKGDPEDPAVVIDTGKSKAIKSNHELN